MSGHNHNYYTESIFNFANILGIKAIVKLFINIEYNNLLLLQYLDRLGI